MLKYLKNKLLVASLFVIIVLWILYAVIGTLEVDTKQKAIEYLKGKPTNEQFEILKNLKESDQQTLSYRFLQKINISKTTFLNNETTGDDNEGFSSPDYKVNSLKNDTLLIHFESGQNTIKSFQNGEWNLSTYKASENINLGYSDFYFDNNRLIQISETRHLSSDIKFNINIFEKDSNKTAKSFLLEYPKGYFLIRYCKSDSNLIFIGEFRSSTIGFVVPINSNILTKYPLEIPKYLKIASVQSEEIFGFNSKDSLLYKCIPKRKADGNFLLELSSRPILEKTNFDLSYSKIVTNNDSIKYIVNYETYKIHPIINSKFSKDSMLLGSQDNFIAMEFYPDEAIYISKNKSGEDIQLHDFKFSGNGIDTMNYIIDSYFMNSKPIITHLNDNVYVTFMGHNIEQITYRLEDNHELKIVNKPNFRWDKIISKSSISLNYNIIILIVILLGILVNSWVFFRSLDKRGKAEEQQRKALRKVLETRLNEDTNKSFEILLNVLEGEEKNMNRTQITANYLLASGILIAVIGIAFSYYEFANIKPEKVQDQDIFIKIKILLSPVLILIFIESLALFFLKQYKNLLNDYKYFHHIYLKRSNYLVLSDLFYLSDQSSDVINKQKIVDDMLEDNQDSISDQNGEFPVSNFKDIAIEIIKKYPSK